MNPQTIKLSKRLTAAASFARPGAFVADVGTDHAYLPLWLLSEGRIRGGVVSDIHKGPIRRAEEHIRLHGASDRLTPVLCDGLDGLAPYAPEDIFILGMGGELIARILSDAPMTRVPGVRLILQPMTHPELLRRFLLEGGYAITDEVLVEEEKIYQIIVAEYTGETSEADPLTLMFGKHNLARGGALLGRLLAHWAAVLEKRKEGRAKSGAASEEEDGLLAAIRQKQEELV